MPYFDPDPVDPELNLKDDIGPGFPNRADDLVKLASAIERKTGAAPHAELGGSGAALAQRFAGRSGERKSDAFPPGYLGAIGAAQIRRGTDPDTVVLKDGPTRDALKSKDGRGAGKAGDPNLGGTFAPLPKLRQPVGPPRSNRAPNRPQDARTLQGKLASLGYVPRVTEKPLFPTGSGRLSTLPFYPSDGRKAADTAGGLQALLDAVRRFQQAKGLKTDALVNPGGPTERALDAQNEKARRARLDRLETVSRKIMASDDPEYASIADRNAADALAGLVVANEVQDQREERLRELKPLSFRPGRRALSVEPSDAERSGGIVPAAGDRKGASGGGSRNPDPLTHGNRLGRRIREERARRERIEQKKADPVGTAKGYVAQIGDKQVRRAVDRMLKDTKEPVMQSGRENLVNLEKDGGRKRAVTDFEKAVREAGGSRSEIKPIDDGFRYTARDGTQIMYREVSRGHGRTNEIHIIRPGEEKKGMIKIRYPDPPAKETPHGPTVP